MYAHAAAATGQRGRAKRKEQGKHSGDTGAGVRENAATATANTLRHLRSGRGGAGRKGHATRTSERLQTRAEEKALSPAQGNTELAQSVGDERGLVHEARSRLCVCVFT